MQRYAQHRNAHFRKHAALALGAIGTEERIAPISALIADEEWLVRMQAMTGVELALDHGRATQPLRDVAFTPTLALIRESESLEIVQPCCLLLSLDRERASEILLSETYFTPSNRDLADVIRAFNEEKIPITHDRLLPLVEELESRPKQGKYDLALANAISACALNPAGDTEERLRRHLGSQDELVARAAAKGLAALAGVTDPWKHVLQQLDEEHSNVEELTVPQEHYFGVLVYDSEVNNGGHVQYFGNSSGGYWKIAIEGLEAVGSPQRAEILREAIALFGKKGPSSDWDRRGEQLAGFSSRKDSQLKGCDDRYFACSDNLSVLLALYALEHREHFTDSSSSQ
ncbi:DMP19 family protein [Maioricimonas rarisocia]|uniref:DMP19 family protein n=1 Tax=Maioricimonas rarisocia TaxID=2528026 RepID=UPI001E4B3169|nr:DUF4375 domain-containing protein [Maioricimonas rarisocia]